MMKCEFCGGVTKDVWSTYGSTLLGGKIEVEARTIKCLECNASYLPAKYEAEIDRKVIAKALEMGIDISNHKLRHKR